MPDAWSAQEHVKSRTNGKLASEAERVLEMVGGEVDVRFQVGLVRRRGTSRHYSVRGYPSLKHSLQKGCHLCNRGSLFD